MKSSEERRIIPVQSDSSCKKAQLAEDQRTARTQKQERCRRAETVSLGMAF